MTNIKTGTSAKKALHGNWSSKITAQLIVSDSISIEEAQQVADVLYYIERRPQEGGRCVIMKTSGGNPVDVLPAPYSARSRAHEYGGGCYCIHKTSVYFINDSDQDIYLIRDNQVSRITTADDKRFADFSYDKKHNRLIAICEKHEHDTVNNSIVSIDVNNGKISEIETSNDFYASPRLNESATQLCWQTWNHPNILLIRL